MTSAPRDMGRLVRLSTAAVRLAAIGLIGAALFGGSAAGGGARTVQIVCYAVGTATVLGWGLLSWRIAGASRRESGYSTALFAVMAATALGSQTTHGGALISFALLAAVAAGAAGPLTRASWVAALGVLAVVAGAVATGAGAVSTLGYFLEVVVALLLGHSRRAYRIRAEQATQLLAQADRLRSEQARVATLDERARIAREIHDVLAHSLGALNIQIQAARALLGEQHDASRALSVLDRAQRLSADGLEETRRAVHALRTDTRPLGQELGALAADFRATHHVPVTVTIEGAERQLRPDSALALLRAAQESLVNAAKHSPGQPVTVTLTFESAHTRLRVSNPLRGTNRDAVEPGPGLQTIDGGYGLTGLRERLLLLEGTLSAHGGTGRWEVTAQVPS